MKILTKFDYLLIIVVLFMSIISNFILTNKLKTTPLNGQVIVYYKGEIYDSYNLDENQTVTINTDYGENKFEIKDSSVNMTYADCPDHYCVKEHAIEYNRQTIVCLPHSLIIKIESDEEPEIDSIAR